MTDYKAVISVLCKFLNSVCDLNVKPEHFRLAKYNKTDNDVVQIFWNLLDSFSRKFDNENSVRNVKLNFASLNYQTFEFYCLPEDMSTGSRELLIAFSWLLAHKSLLQSKLREDLLKSQLKEEFCPVSHEYVPSESSDEFSFDTMQDYCDFILRTLGKINYNLRMINEYSNKTAELIAKVDKEKNNFRDTSQLSIAELLYTKNPDKMQKYLKDIEKVSVLLENYSKWEKVAEHYWKWMNSVLDEKEKVSKKDIDLDMLTPFLNYLKANIKDLPIPTPSQVVEDLETSFPRCFHIQGANSDETAIIDNKLKLEDNRNLQVISEFLQLFL